MEVALGFRFDEVLQAGIVKKAAVDEIVDWLRVEKLPDHSPERVTQFLVSCDGDCDAAKATIRSYLRITNGSDEMFSNRNPKRIDMQKYLNVGEICILPERTGDGCVVLFNRLVDYNYRNFDMGVYFTVLTMTIESAIYDYPANGLITVFDTVGLTWSHLTCLRLGMTRTFVHYLQEALPVKLRKICLINATPVLERFITVIRPFVRKEVLDKMEVYLVADMHLFYEKCLPKRLLPIDYGGEMLPFQVLHRHQVEKFKTLGPYFAAEEKQRKRVRQ